MRSTERYAPAARSRRAAPATARAPGLAVAAQVLGVHCLPLWLTDFGLHRHGRAEHKRTAETRVEIAISERLL